jgi:hypothetical protein
LNDPFNSRERVFAKAWQDENERYSESLLAWMIGDGSRPGFPSARDYTVAATVVQWLGTPVGKIWLDEVLKKCETGKTAAKT